MISQSGTLYKIVVTACFLLGGYHLKLTNGSPVNSDAGVASGISHALFNLRYPPSGPSDGGLYYTAGDIAAAESGSFFGDGAISSHQLHGLIPGDNIISLGTGGSQYFVAPQNEQADDLQTAGQSYFIEPPTSTTTTQRPTFKKRKTRRPISSLAEKSKKAKEAERDNAPNNEIPQGNPVPFNPFRQIVNTSFGRTRPSDNKQERTRSRAKAANLETGSVVDVNNEEKGIDSLNEVANKAEGEPRVLGRRRPAQDVRPIRPTSTAASDDSNSEPLNKGRRFPLRKPRPNFDGAAAPTPVDNADNVNQKQSRPKLLGKRPRPRPTTTIIAPATDTDSPTETTDPVTVYHPTSPQPLPVVTDSRPKVRPARPLGVSRFANAHRNTATTTARPHSSDSVDESLSSLPPSHSPRRRPLRPTTRISLVTSTESPEDILGHFATSAPPAPSPGRGRNEGGQKPRDGFVLRPRPTPITGPAGDGNEQPIQNEVGIRKPLSNRKRKRPTTTAAAPASPVDYSQDFFGGAGDENVIPAAPIGDRERIVPGRRVTSVLRTRPTQHPSLPINGPPAYQIRQEQPVAQPIQPESLGIPNNGGFISHQQGSNIGGTNNLRRPTTGSLAQGSPIQNAFNNNPALTDSYSNSNIYQFPSQDNLGFYPGGFDNVLGVPSNLRNIQQNLGAAEFSSRSAITSNEPEIGDSDFPPASASTEKQAIAAPDTEDAAATPDKDPESKGESEQKKVPPAKLSPLERLQQNRQAAARKLLARKPTEKTTAAPVTSNQKTAVRKSLIPPRMLRPRGKLPGTAAVAEQEKTVPDNGGENYSGAAEDKPNTDSKDIATDNGNDSVSSAAETDKESVIGDSAGTKPEETEASTKKPSILEAAKRRRVSPALSKNAVAPLPQIQKVKATPPPPAHQEPEAPPPNCDDGQRYSKFLKRCITMYKPKAQG